MPYFCSAPGCDNFSNRKVCIEKGTTFHQFPLKNDMLLRFWLVQMDRADFTPDSTSYLCSEHFEQNCFYYHKSSGRRVLQRDAVPTKFGSLDEGEEENEEVEEENEEVEEENEEVEEENEEVEEKVAKEDNCNRSTVPTVLRLTEAKKRKLEDNDYDLTLVHGSLTASVLYAEDASSSLEDARNVSVQTAISGISTQLIPHASSSRDYSGMRFIKDAQVQTKMDGISALLIENTVLQNELAQLKNRVNQLTFGVEIIAEESLMKSLTGFSKELFKAIYSYLCIEKQLAKYAHISAYNQYFAFSIYLRTGISQLFLSILFKISQAGISRLISNVSNFIYNRIRSIKLWPTREHINRKTSPVFFRSYPNCRVILETVEFQIQRPTSVQTQRLTFSQKKNTFTIKGLVGKTPTGGISFISDIWPGSISDRDLFIKSGIINYLDSEDLVIAEKSFNIKEELQEKGCFLGTPKFLTDRIPFTSEEQMRYPEQTHHRVHYDLATSKFNKFKFFESGQITSMNFDIVNEYFYVVGFLINFGKPLIHIRQH